MQIENTREAWSYETTNLTRVGETEANWARKPLHWPGLGQENCLRLPPLERTGWSFRSRAAEAHAEQGWGRQDLKVHNASASYCVFRWFLPPVFLLKVCIFCLGSGWAGTTGEKKMAVAQIFLLLASCHRQWIQGLDHCGKLQLGPQKRKSKKVTANQGTWPSGVHELEVSTGGRTKLPAWKGELARS